MTVQAHTNNKSDMIWKIPKFQEYNYNNNIITKFRSVNTT